MIISIIVVVILLRRSLRPLQVLAARAQEVAKGDLTVTVPVTSDNEVGRVASSFNEMTVNLQQLIRELTKTSNEVSQSAALLKETANQTELASNEIALSITEVAHGAEAQMTSSSESQEAMMEMAIGIQRVAESSSAVSELATDTATLSENGGVVMERTVTQMGMIESYVQEAQMRCAS